MSVEHITGTSSNTLSIGNYNTQDGYVWVRANINTSVSPYIRYNQTTLMWEFSHDGVISSSFSSVPKHNDLEGLSVLGTTGGYYHLSTNEATWLVNSYTNGYWETLKGGTGNNSYTKGDILYASETNVLSKRSIGTTGQVLTVAGDVPIWATPTVAASIDLEMEKAAIAGQSCNLGTMSTNFDSTVTTITISGTRVTSDIAYLGNGQLLGAFNDSSADNSNILYIRKSYDYGKTWKKIPVNTSIYSWISSVCYVGNGICIAGECANNYASIHYSTDFGETWIKSTSSISPYSIFKIIKCKDNVILAFTYNGSSTAKIYKSTNLGVTWTESYTYSGGGDYYSAVVYCGNGCIIVPTYVDNGYNGIRSINNGDSWTPILIDTGWKDVVNYSWIRSIIYCGNGICIAAHCHAANNLYIARSTDYGATWTRSTTTYKSLSNAVYMGNGRVIICVYNDSYLESLDYGATWTLVTKSTADLPYNANWAYYLDNGTILMGGITETIYKISLAPTKPALPEPLGGTNQSSYVKGDILYASDKNKLSKLSIGTAGQVLTVNSGLIPTWTTSGGLAGSTIDGKTVLGYNASIASGAGGVCIGTNATLTGDGIQGIAIGNNTRADYQSIVIGDGANTSGGVIENLLAIGTGAGRSGIGVYSTLIGNWTGSVCAVGEYSTIIGHRSGQSTTQTYTISLGHKSRTTGNNSIVIGTANSDTTFDGKGVNTILIGNTSQTDTYLQPNALRIGTSLAGDKFIYAQNADTNKPYIKYDDTAKEWQISKDGTNKQTIATESVLVSNVQSTNSNVWVRASTKPINGSQFSNPTFYAVLERTSTEFNIECKLYNRTTGADVTGSLLTIGSTALGPIKVSASVSLAAGENLYDVLFHITTTSPGVSDTCAISFAGLTN